MGGVLGYFRNFDPRCFFRKLRRAALRLRNSISEDLIRLRKTAGLILHKSSLLLSFKKEAFPCLEVFMRFSYKTTVVSCFTAYIVQAIVNNFVPLLFITFQNIYSIPLERITLLVTINFAVQLAVDLVSAKFVDKIGYRISMISAHILSAAGLILLAFLPEAFADPFVGILVSVTVYAIGGGLLEVLVSPVMESCPSDNKEKAMSLLHSFYCFGQVGVVLVSTLFFAAFGTGSWRILAFIWAVLPIVNAVMFTKVPIGFLIADGERGMTAHELFSSKTFVFLFIMMLCAGASEQSVSQWASAFAEKGLGISKSAGDLAGPMAFALFMGGTRAFYGKYGDRIELDRFMGGSALLCVISYLLISLAPSPVISLAGCALCGMSVGIMWPGTFSKASASLRRGGTAMFALLALAGDLGCSGGPTIVGLVSEKAGGNMKTGILSAVVFPALMFLCIIIVSERKTKKKAFSKKS